MCVLRSFFVGQTKSDGEALVVVARGGVGRTRHSHALKGRRTCLYVPIAEVWSRSGEGMAAVPAINKPGIQAGEDTSRPATILRR